MLLLVFAVFLNILILAENLVSYEGYSLYRITPQTESQLKYLLKLNANTSSGLDFWLRTTAVNHSADVMVFPWVKDSLTKDIGEKQIPYSVLIPDLGKIIEEDMEAAVKLPKKLKFFSKYQSVEKMYSFMQKLADHYSFVNIEEIGSSYEGRPLFVIQISTDSGIDKPVIWIQGGAHAREMIGPAVCFYFAQKLATSFLKDNETAKLIKSFDWYIYPIVNPDGYEYARTTDRLWRKTRSENEKMPDCFGADANRNWNFHWSGSLGSSLNPCSHNYAGVSPFSEPETHAIASFMQEKIPNNLHIFLDFHSYSQRWLSPWGYTSSLPRNYLKQIEMAETATKALEKLFGTKYSVGSSGNIMYTVTGGARDWVHGVLGTPFAYVVELRDNGQKGGFLLPKNQILPTAEETWAGISAMVSKAADIYYAAQPRYEERNNSEKDISVH